MCDLYALEQNLNYIPPLPKIALPKSLVCDGTGRIMLEQAPLCQAGHPQCYWGGHYCYNRNHVTATARQKYLCKHQAANGLWCAVV